MSDAESIARVLEHSVITFAGVVQTDLGPKAANIIRSLCDDLEESTKARAVDRQYLTDKFNWKD